MKDEAKRLDDYDGAKVYKSRADQIKKEIDEIRDDWNKSKQSQEGEIGADDIARVVSQRRIEQALSLRQPQKDSLDILAQILERIELKKDISLEETLRVIQDIHPSVKDFERIFPCLCFAIATGVGKTRLMGAMIAYIHAEYKVKNFMVLAPNLTIYNKLKQDFTPNTPKYVFPGLTEYVGTPQIITGDDYNQVGGLFDNPNDDRLRINIFNISKINSDQDSRGTPRVRRMAEYLGQSYFDYLAGLKDLVLIMDEAHRYRASAGMAAINELHPVLGIELTATAKSTGAKGKAFRNIAYEYNLAHAITDGYVKKPSVVGRSNFDKELYGANSIELENLKIVDAITPAVRSRIVLQPTSASTLSSTALGRCPRMASDPEQAKRWTRSKPRRLSSIWRIVGRRPSSKRSSMAAPRPDGVELSFARAAEKQGRSSSSRISRSSAHQKK